MGMCVCEGVSYTSTYLTHCSDSKGKILEIRRKRRQSEEQKKAEELVLASCLCKWKAAHETKYTENLPRHESVPLAL